MKARTLFLTLTLIGGASASAIAADSTAAPYLHGGTLVSAHKTEKINYADLDIGNKAGAAVLLARVRLAATQVCGPEPKFDLDSYYGNCVRDTMTSSIKAINRPLVSELYRNKYGVDVAAIEVPSQGVSGATHH